MARRNTTTAKAGAKASATKVKVDFTGVEVRVLLPEGVYDAKVDEVTLEPNDGKPYLKWKFLTIDDDPKLNDKPLYNNTSLQPQSLWVLGSLLETLGVERPDGEMDLDLPALVGLELGLVVEHEEYEGKNRAKVVDFTPANGAEGDEDEVQVGDDEGTTYTTDEVNEADADTLDAIVEASGIEVKKSKKIAVYRASVLAALEEAELINDDAGEEGDALTEDDVLAMSAEELDALVEEHELDVKKSKKLSVYAANVAAAMEEADLLGSAEDGEDEGDEAAEGYTEEEVAEMDDEDLAGVVQKHGLKVKHNPKLAVYRKAVLAALQAAELITEADEEPEGYTEDQIKEMDQGELDALNKEHGLKVKMTKVLKKNHSLVIDALEAAELMADDE